MERKTFIYVPNKRQYLFIVDAVGREAVSDILAQVQANNASFELFQINGDRTPSELPKEIERWLHRRKMGTYLYAAVSWEKLNVITHISEEVGFTGEEAQYQGIGEKDKAVFCCRCHGMTRVQNSILHIECPYCLSTLSISDHYSKLKEAYLGYTDIQ